MRRFNWLMTILVAGAMTFAACGEDPTKTPDTPDTPDNPAKELTFSVELGDVTRTTVTYTATPSNLDVDYFAVAFEAAAVEQCDTDADIVAMIYADIEEYASSIDKTFDGYMAENVVKGKREDVKITGLNSGTNYYLLLFGVDATDGYKATSDVSLTRFKTASAELSSCTFTIKAEPYLNNASISVTPSDNYQGWTLVNVDVDTLTSYTSADGEYGWTKEQFFANYVQTEIDNLKAEGLSDDEIRTKLIYQGTRTLYAGNLKAKTKYACFAAGVQLDSEGLWVSTSLKELRYNSGEQAASDLTFDIEVFNIDHYSAEVRITPSDPNAEYYYYVSYIDTPKSNMKPIDIANNAVTEYIYYWDNYTELKRRDPVKGVTDLTGDNKLELNIAETEYYIVAFSFEPNPNYGKPINEETGEYDQNPGTITSAPVYVSFVTSEQGDPMTAEFEFSASEVGPYDFTLKIDASDPTIYYQPGIGYADSFDPNVAMADASTLLAQVMEMCMTGQSPSLTIQEALEEKCSHLYRNGDGEYYIANLQPEREYIGYVLAIDTKTGKFARCVYSDVIATTTTPGGVNPTVELLGVYNGDEENGSIFGDSKLTQGRPIVAVKHTGAEDATALFSAISTDAYDDVVKLSDQYIIASFRGYWQSVNLTVPYHFFVAEWDTDQTVVSYAQDANGAEGKVARLAVKPVTPGDIEELKGYVDEVNNAAPKAMAKSLVIAEDVEPTLECIWSEEVAAPREAKVTRHEVEPLVQKSDLVEVKVIKAFRL